MEIPIPAKAEEIAKKGQEVGKKAEEAKKVETSKPEAAKPVSVIPSTEEKAVEKPKLDALLTQLDKFLVDGQAQQKKSMFEEAIAIY